MMNSNELEDAKDPRFLLAKLQQLEKSADDSDPTTAVYSEENLNKRIDLANNILKILDVNTQVQSNEKQKNLLVDTLVAKGCALCSMIELKRQSNQAAADASHVTDLLMSQVQQVYLRLYTINNELHKDPKVSRFLELHALVNQHYARYIKLLTKSGPPQTLETELKVIWAYKQLGWHHMANHAERQLHAKYPKSYRPF